MIFVTVAARNYMSKALLWARTLRACHPDALLVLCQPERELEHPDALGRFFDYCVAAHELGVPDFEGFSFRHSLMELATAVKPRLLLHLFQRFPQQEAMVFLDPDIWVFSPMVEIEQQLKSHDILVTPHHLTDEDTYEGIADNVLRTLQCGVFNLGFLALRRGERSRDFLQWWMNKTEMLCYVDVQLGLFVDQKWVDLAVSFFELGVLTHQGYNVANWNISKRRIQRNASGYSVNGHWPLRFFHFSGIDADSDLFYFNRYAPEPDHPAQTLRRSYKAQIGGIASGLGWATSWSYACYESGEIITDAARAVFRRNPGLLAGLGSPYALSNEFLLASS